MNQFMAPMLPSTQPFTGCHTPSEAHFLLISNHFHHTPPCTDS
jgi:hypothetical protein